MKRLWCRFVLVGLAMSLLLSSISFSLSVSQTMVFRQTVPGAAVSVHCNQEGWLVHFNLAASRFRSKFEVFGPRHSDNTWEKAVEDLAPTWIGSAIVYAKWGPAELPYILFGVKHFVMIPGLAIATLLYALWFRRRWKDDTTD